MWSWVQIDTSFICKTKNIDFSEIGEYLDLLAVSIGADIVDVTGENRVLSFLWNESYKPVS